MKIKEGFILHHIADQWIAIAVGDVPETKNILITLNKTGAFVWELLQKDMSYQEVICRMTDRYAIDEEVARQDLNYFLENVRNANLLEE